MLDPDVDALLPEYGSWCACNNHPNCESELSDVAVEFDTWIIAIIAFRNYLDLWSP